MAQFDRTVPVQEKRAGSTVAANANGAANANATATANASEDTTLSAAQSQRAPAPPSLPGGSKSP